MGKGCRLGCRLEGGPLAMALGLGCAATRRLVHRSSWLDRRTTPCGIALAELLLDALVPVRAWGAPAGPGLSVGQAAGLRAAGVSTSGRSEVASSPIRAERCAP